MTAPRGLRNNNPGNIRLSTDKWQGQVPGEDDAFVTFATMAYGIRALVVLLRSYRSKYGLDTVRKIISRWAPPSENDTEAYVAAVCKPGGLDPDAVLPNDRLTYEYLARRIALHENGRDAEQIDKQDWIEGLDMAFGSAVAAPQPEPVIEPPVRVKEKKMSPFILPAFEFLTTVVPTLIRHFGKGERSETNAKTVETVVNVAKGAIGAINEQELVERIKEDPTLVQVVEKATVDNWFQIIEAGGGGIAGARQAEMQMMAALKGEPWYAIFRSPSFWALLLLVPLVYLIVFSMIGVIGNVTWSDDVRAGLAGMITGTIVGGAVGYYWGQTTSRNRVPAQ
jgi:hypothetical protein